MSAATALLATKLRIVSNCQYTTLREIMSDWPRLRDHMRQCQNCPAVGDEEYDGIEVDNGVWWCATCAAELSEDEDAQQAGRAEEIGKAAQRDLGKVIRGEEL